MVYIFYIFISLLVVILSKKHLMLIERYEKLYNKYVSLVYKWNDLVIEYNNTNGFEKSFKQEGLYLTKKEARFILKRIHSDITKSKKNDYLVKKLIKIIKER